MNKKMLFPLVLTAVSAFLITVSGIVFKQEIFRIIPLYISLFVGVLQMKANRFSYLIGCINCLIYTVAYTSIGLYASAASALFFSAPMQLITFWSWNKKSYKRSTKFRSLNVKGWILIVVAFTVSFFVVNFVLNSVDSSYAIIESVATLVGIVTSILSLLCYREYSWTMVVSAVMTLALYIVVAIDDPAQITYTVYAINSMICVVCQFFAVQAIYAEQRRADAIAANGCGV